jgi:ABC-type transport system substrate-binding protein
MVVERPMPDDDAALAELVRGDVDAIDRVPPWLLEQARQAADVVVGQYALPTVHMLVPNPKHPLLAMREYRRALCYGADREGIVRDILLGGEPATGFVALSGPFPAGVGLNDPLGYGYNPDILPRSYEPRLAALLASVARATLAKRDLAERKARGEEVPEPDPTVEPTLPPPTPLVLAHPSDPLARVACQALKLQLDRVGLPIQLVELPADGADAALEYDLLYVEAAIWEPLLDARRLLGDNGVGGAGSALMAAALDELAKAENWNEARRRLREIHRIAHFDLPVIPLWQTVNYFAHRTWLDGVGDRPLTLYQNLDEWRREFDRP